MGQGRTDVADDFPKLATPARWNDAIKNTHTCQVFSSAPRIRSALCASVRSQWQSVLPAGPWPELDSCLDQPRSDRCRAHAERLTKLSDALAAFVTSSQN